MDMFDQIIGEYDKSIESQKRDMLRILARLEQAVKGLTDIALGDGPVDLYCEKISSLAQGVAIVHQRIGSERVAMSDIQSLKNKAVA